MRTRAAFSVLEVIVTIAIIAIIFSILIPVLGRARIHSREIASLANVRTLHSIIALYSGDHDDYYPAWRPGEKYQISENEWIGDNSWFSIYVNWPGTVYAYLPIDQNADVYVSPTVLRRRNGQAWPTSYRYSSCFVGHPSIWMEGTLPELHLRTAQQSADVLFPSKKVLLWDADFPLHKASVRYKGPDLAEKVPMVSADGQGFVRRPADASPAIENPFGQVGADLRLNNTPKGIHGMDYN